MRAVRKLFLVILPFTSMSRTMEENYLWASHNSCKLPDKVITSESCIYHQQKVADIFNELRTISPAAVPLEHSDDTHSNVESMQPDTEYAGNQLAEDDVFIEQK